MQNLHSANQAKTRLETLCRALQQERTRLNGLLEEYRSHPLPSDKGDEDVPKIIKAFDSVQLEKAQKEKKEEGEQDEKADGAEAQGKDEDLEKNVKDETDGSTVPVVKQN